VTPPTTWPRALYHSGDGLWDAFWEQRRRRLASSNSCTK
jgi:hypothetical protein